MLRVEPPSTLEIRDERRCVYEWACFLVFHERGSQSPSLLVRRETETWTQASRHGDLRRVPLPSGHGGQLSGTSPLHIAVGRPGPLCRFVVRSGSWSPFAASQWSRASLRPRETGLASDAPGVKRFASVRCTDPEDRKVLEQKIKE